MTELRLVQHANLFDQYIPYWPKALRYKIFIVHSLDFEHFKPK